MWYTSITFQNSEVIIGANSRDRIFNCHNSKNCYIKQSVSVTIYADVNRRITEIIQQKDAIIANLHESLSRKITAPLRKVHGRLFGC
jgi:hypothetical protein